MHSRAALVVILLLLNHFGNAQDHAWRLRHSGNVVPGINPLNPNTVFASLVGGGNDTLIVSYNKGLTWTTQAIGIGGNILVHPADTLIVFANGDSGAVRSSD